ncbi:MAG: AraC family transcriptional regulator [Actinoplanes sp.]
MDILAEVIASVRAGRAEASYVNRSGAWGMRYASFAGSGFHIVLRGSGWLIPASGEPRELRTGDVVLSPFGGEHGLSHAPARLERLPPAILNYDPIREASDIELLCGAYRLDRGPVPPYLRALPALIAISPEYDHHPQLRSLVDLLAVEVRDTGPGAGAARRALLDLFLTHLLRQWLEIHRDARLPDTSDPAVGAALAAMHASPDKPWTNDQLGAVAGLSRTAFIRRFSASLGQTPSAYLTDWRLALATRLLHETKAPLATIARQVGYSTGFAFGNAFRRQYGITPGRFREWERS